MFIRLRQNSMDTPPSPGNLTPESKLGTSRGQESPECVRDQLRAVGDHEVKTLALAGENMIKTTRQLLHKTVLYPGSGLLRR